MTKENSGLSCDYYSVYVSHVSVEYKAECADIAEALDMTANEANMFKEIWRSAAQRQGKKKKGHSQLRGAEKILWQAKRNYNLKKKGMR